MTKPTYRGRFAPSPTGPLHFGSLIAAVASYCQAHSKQGEWWLRIEDIDPPREAAGASDDILRTLEAFGFEWDGPVIYQSQRLERYHAAIEQLKHIDMLYPCACSRREVAEQNHDGIYPGTCRNGLPAGRKPRTWRVRTRDTIEVADAIQGRHEFDLPREAGDFTVLRADGLIAYQLAVGLDDAEQGMTEVLRGADLFDSTPRQIYLQQLLDLASPGYAHHPVVVNQHGQKLSKQNLAPALDARHAGKLLWRALDFLGQQPEAGLQQARPATLWEWAMEYWQLKKVPKLRSIRSMEFQ